MDEARRFFRYTIPGFAFILELLVASYFSFEFSTIDKLDFIKEYNDVGTVLATFIISGVLGYFFTTFYFVLHWCKYAPFFKPTDHKSLLMSLALREKINIKNVKGDKVFIEELNQIESTDLFTLLFYQAMAADKNIERIEIIKERLLNFKHGNGAVILSSLFAFLFWFLIFWPICNPFNELCRFDFKAVIVIFFWVLLIVILCINFHILKLRTRRIDNSPLATYYFNKDEKNTEIVFDITRQETLEINSNETRTSLLP